MWTAPVPVSMVTNSAGQDHGSARQKRMLRADAFEFVAGK